MEKHYDMLQKSQTYDMMNWDELSTQRLCRKLGSVSLLSLIVPHTRAMAPCGGQALKPSLPILLWHRLTLVIVLLARRASARAWASKSWEDFVVPRWHVPVIVDFHLQDLQYLIEFLYPANWMPQDLAWISSISTIPHSGCARSSDSVSHRSTAPQPWPPQRCPSLKAFVSDLVLLQVDSCHDLVDTKGVGEGLQSWHEAKANLKNQVVVNCERIAAVLNYLHGQLAVRVAGTTGIELPS